MNAVLACILVILGLIFKLYEIHDEPYCAPKPPSWVIIQQ